MPSVFEIELSIISLILSLYAYEEKDEAELTAAQPEWRSRVSCNPAPEARSIFYLHTSQMQSSLGK